MWAPLEDVSSYILNEQQIYCQGMLWSASFWYSRDRSCLCSVQKNAFCLETRQYWVRIPHGLTPCPGKYWKARLKGLLTWFISTEITTLPLHSLFHPRTFWKDSSLRLHGTFSFITFHQSGWNSFIVKWFLALFWFALFACFLLTSCFYLKLLLLENSFPSVKHV